MTAGVVLGAPKVIAVADEIRRTLGSVRMDICAFVGVASKGPARRPRLADGESIDLSQLVTDWDNRDRTVAVKINSWDQFRILYGGFESPGRLPYAVANFFEQGGQEAYICRIVHAYSSVSEDHSAVARASLTNLSTGGTTISLAAKNEGQWGNQLKAATGFTFTPVLMAVEQSSTTLLSLTDLNGLCPGCLLRIVNDDADNPADNFAAYRFVGQIDRLGDFATSLLSWQLDLSGEPLPAKPSRAQWVQGQVLILDESSGHSEAFNELGLSPSHERFIGRVLLTDSQLVDPQQDWLLSSLLPPEIDPYQQDFSELSSTRQLVLSPAAFSGGVDRYQDIVHEDFFDAGWVLGDERPGSGIHSLSHSADCSVLVIPDLYVPEPFEAVSEEQAPVLFSGEEFAPCFDYPDGLLETESATPTLPGLILDPANPTDRQKIIYLQQQAVYLAQQLAEFIVLLDVPPQLTQQQILQWRTQFNSPYCAAYHPWLKANQYDSSGALQVNPKIINPSAVAAGIIAATELQSTLAHGPANRIAKSVFALESAINSVFHDRIHPLGVNGFVQQRDGIWLTAARTLSTQSQWRQLSVVRLMVMLRRSLYQQMQWLVFEPNTPALWSDVKCKLESFLRQLYIAGVFKGDTPQQAFFVRCDDRLNTKQVIDAGKLMVEIGVAPAEPLEFILVQISRQADGTLKIVSD